MTVLTYISTNMLKILKNWTLPISMITGALFYLIFANVEILSPAKPFISTSVAFLTPSLIFAQLLLTFCRIDTKELKPQLWHLWVLLFQLVACCGVAAIILFGKTSLVYKEILEGAMVCLICPTATAAAVITAKLGGNASSLTTYTLMSNILASIVVPLLFPLVEPHNDVTFSIAFLKILSKVLPLLMFPFFAALLLKHLMPKVHNLLKEHSNIAFYMWAVALAIVSGQTVKSIVDSDASFFIQIMIAAAGLVTCCMQFYLGRRIGSKYNETITVGQALGQKNTVLAIWMTYTYLDPVASVAPGSYVLWQNSINTWQLWKKRKEDEKIKNTNN